MSAADRTEQEVGRTPASAGTRPYTDAHAIVWVDMGFSFSQGITEEALADVRPALSKLLLPEGFKKGRTGKAKSENLASFERRSEDGEILEVVHLHRGHFHVVTHEYRGWDFTKARSLSRLFPVFHALQNAGIAINKWVLVFRDGFLNDDIGSYSPADVVRPNQYIPRAALSAGPFWNSSFVLNIDNESPVAERAWSNSFSRLVVDARIRENDKKHQHVTFITHSQMMFRNFGIRKKVKWSEDHVDSVLDLMHDKNADLLREVLSLEMVDRIGLTEEKP